MCCLNGVSVMPNGYILSSFEIFLSVFLGFFSALFVQSLGEKSKSKKLKKQLLNDLKNELNAVYKQINELKTESTYVYPYKIPVWNGAVKSNSILSLDKVPNFLKILEVFASVEEANIIEMECFELLMSNNCVDMSKVFGILNENRQYLKGIVEEGMTLFKR